jgi:hypothetical protein
LLMTDGVRGFYRGLTPSLISVMPYFAVRFGVYDILKATHVRISNGTAIPSQFSAVYGFCAGLAASGLTFPFEVIRRRAMVGQAASNPFLAIPNILRTEGVAGLYKGYFVNHIPGLRARSKRSRLVCARADRARGGAGQGHRIACAHGLVKHVLIERGASEHDV